nr:MAG: hypothetical protein [Arizlama virus]
MTTGKRQDREADHKDIVISNVEFCMMQFYKMQWETQQHQNQQLERENKRIKRDAAHYQAVIHQLHEDTHGLEWELERAHSHEAMLTTNIRYLQQRLTITQNRQHAAEDGHLKTLRVIGRIFRDHPEIEEQNYQEELTANLLADLNHQDDLNTQELNELDLVFDDGEETEPDENLQQLMQDNII